MPASSKDRQPLELVWRLTLPEQPSKRTSCHRSTSSTEQTYTPSEAEFREQAAWQQVRGTGKPVHFEDKWLMPEGMSVWDAIELLPEGIREQTRTAMQQRVAEAYYAAIKRTRAIIREVAERSEVEQYDSLPYAAQMAIAESVVRQQLELPEIPLEELIKRYGA